MNWYKKSQVLDTERAPMPVSDIEEEFYKPMPTYLEEVWGRLKSNLPHLSKEELNESIMAYTVTRRRQTNTLAQEVINSPERYPLMSTFSKEGLMEIFTTFVRLDFYDTTWRALQSEILGT